MVLIMIFYKFYIKLQLRYYVFKAVENKDQYR